MPPLPGINHLDAVRALQKAGGTRIVSIPRHNPVNAITMGKIVRDAGLTNDEFRNLL
jgi:hypothetical protein